MADAVERAPSIDITLFGNNKDFNMAFLARVGLAGMSAKDIELSTLGQNLFLPDSTASEWLLGRVIIGDKWRERMLTEYGAPDEVTAWEDARRDFKKLLSSGVAQVHAIVVRKTNELVDARDRIGILTQQVGDLKHQLDDAYRAQREAESNLDDAVQRLDNAKVKSKSLKADIKWHRQQLTEANTKINSLNYDLGIATESLRHAGLAYEEAIKELRELGKAKEEAASRIEQVEDGRKDAEQRLVELAQRAADYQASLTKYRPLMPSESEPGTLPTSDIDAVYTAASTDFGQNCCIAVEFVWYCDNEECDCGGVRNYIVCPHCHRLAKRNYKGKVDFGLPKSFGFDRVLTLPGLGYYDDPQDQRGNIKIRIVRA